MRAFANRTEQSWEGIYNIEIIAAGGDISPNYPCALNPNKGASVIRIGFGGIIYYNYDNESPKPYFNCYQGPYISV